MMETKRNATSKSTSDCRRMLTKAGGDLGSHRRSVGRSWRRQVNSVPDERYANQQPTQVKKHMAWLLLFRLCIVETAIWNVHTKTIRSAGRRVEAECIGAYLADSPY